MSHAQHERQVDVDLPADLTAPRAARDATRGALRSWRLAKLLDPVLLTVSELVGNAIRHGRPPVALRLRRHGPGVQVAVHDEDPQPPRQPGDDVGRESGRGLLLVRALASETGVEQVQDDGKVVWAQIEPGEDAEC